MEREGLFGGGLDHPGMGDTEGLQNLTFPQLLNFQAGPYDDDEVLTPALDMSTQLRPCNGKTVESLADASRPRMSRFR